MEINEATTQDAVTPRSSTDPGEMLDKMSGWVFGGDRPFSNSGS